MLERLLMEAGNNQTSRFYAIFDRFGVSIRASGAGGACDREVRGAGVGRFRWISRTAFSADPFFSIDSFPLSELGTLP